MDGQQPLRLRRYYKARRNAPRELTATEWWVLALLASGLASGVVARLWWVGEWRLQYLVEALLIQAGLLVTYLAVFTSVDHLARAHVRYRQLLTDERRAFADTVRSLESQAARGAENENIANHRLQKTEESNRFLQRELERLQSTSAMQEEIDRYKNLYRNVQIENATLKDQARQRMTGQSLVEYAVIVVLLVIVVAVAVPPIGQWVARWVLILAGKFNQV